MQLIEQLLYYFVLLIIPLLILHQFMIKLLLLLGRGGAAVRALARLLLLRLLGLCPLMHLDLFLQLSYFSVEDQHFLLVSYGFLGQFLSRLLELGELLYLYNHFPI